MYFSLVIKIANSLIKFCYHLQRRKPKFSPIPVSNKKYCNFSLVLHINSLWLSDIYLGQYWPKLWLVAWLSEPVLVYHQRCPVPLISEQKEVLTNLMWRHQMETFSVSLAICEGNSLVPGEFPAQRPVTRSFDVFFDLRLNKRLSKQSWGWRFDTLLRPLWCHSNVFGGCTLEITTTSPRIQWVDFQVLSSKYQKY